MPHPGSSRNKGAALVMVMIIVMILLSIGVTLLLTASSDLQISGGLAGTSHSGTVKPEEPPILPITDPGSWIDENWETSPPSDWSIHEDAEGYYLVPNAPGQSGSTFIYYLQPFVSFDFQIRPRIISHQGQSTAEVGMAVRDESGNLFMFYLDLKWDKVMAGIRGQESSVVTNYDFQVGSDYYLRIKGDISAPGKLQLTFGHYENGSLVVDYTNPNYSTGFYSADANKKYYLGLYDSTANARMRYYITNP